MLLHPQEKSLASNYALRHPLSLSEGVRSKPKLCSQFYSPEPQSRIDSPHSPKPLAEPFRAGRWQSKQWRSLSSGACKTQSPGVRAAGADSTNSKKKPQSSRKCASDLLFHYADDLIFFLFSRKRALPKDHYAPLRGAHFWRTVVTEVLILFILFVNFWLIHLKGVNDFRQN